MYFVVWVAEQQGQREKLEPHSDKGEISSLLQRNDQIGNRPSSAVEEARREWSNNFKLLRKQHSK